ncbi:hypothetical protein D9M69_731520 [compost metagenome]
MGDEYLVGATILDQVDVIAASELLRQKLIAFSVLGCMNRVGYSFLAHLGKMLQTLLMQHYFIGHSTLPNHGVHALTVA